MVLNKLLKKKTNYLRHGYILVEFFKLMDINSNFYLLRHKRTGASHIHLENDDSNNCFSIVFKTIPIDSKGIPHILEHVVLCGSRNYPVKDPFFSMLKRSLSTFMNAFTSSDWTMYPFSSQNKKDFYNLLSVYLDSVFFPLLRKISFRQEGFRLEINNEEKEKFLSYKGIVYNEMKGVMSSPDQVMIRSLLKSLYPDTVYSNDSGGDPKEILKFRYKELSDFHRKYYNPSNSFFYTYGNFPLEDHLMYINDYYLSKCTSSKKIFRIQKQRRWKIEKEIHCDYSLSKEDFKRNRCQVCVAWLTAKITDSFEILVLMAIEQILIGNEASHIRKVLIDSNLGSSLSDGSGFYYENLDTMFSLGLKDVFEKDAYKIKEIIFSELSKVVERGISKKDIDSVLHQVEINRKEKSNIPYPYGIKLLLSFSSCWIHGGSVSKILRIDDDLEKMKRHISSGNFFEDKIKHYFLNNKHRILFILKPKKNLEEKESDATKKELLYLKKSFINKDIEKIKFDLAKLNNLMNEKENLSCLPSLKIRDIEKKIKKINDPIFFLKNPDINCYGQNAEDLFFFYGLIDVSTVSEKSFGLIPFFCFALTKLGTYKKKYTEMARNIDLYTGGMSLAPYSYTKYDSYGSCLPFISISSKSLVYNISKMFKIVSEILSEINLENINKIVRLLYEYKSGLESILLRNGHKFAISLSSRNFSVSNYINEIWSGVLQLREIKKNIEEINKGNLKFFIDGLKNIYNQIIVDGIFKFAFIGDLRDIKKFINSNKYLLFLKNSSYKSDFSSGVDLFIDKGVVSEAWAISTSVSFVAQSFQTEKFFHDDSPALSVLSKIIKSSYLHKEIREKRGAYGVFSAYDTGTGTFSFCSYRDPNIFETLNVYNNISKFLLETSFSNQDIVEAILQVCSEIDKPLFFSSNVKTNFVKKYIKLTYSMKQIYKTGLLKLKKRDLERIAWKYFNYNSCKKSVVIISNKKLLNEAKSKLLNSKLDIKLDNVFFI